MSGVGPPAALAGLPIPVLAQRQEEAGVEVGWLVVGAALVAAGWYLYRSRPSKHSWPADIAILGLAIIVAALLIPRARRDEPASQVAVEITRPPHGATVAARLPVTLEVELRGATLAPRRETEEGGHLHLYVDGELEQMPRSKRIEVRLERGNHELTVEYVDVTHVSFDPPIRDTVEVSAR